MSSNHDLEKLLDNIVKQLNNDFNTESVKIYSTKDKEEILNWYVAIFDTPLKDHMGNILYEEMVEHMSFLDMTEEFESDDKYSDSNVLYRYDRLKLYKPEIEKINKYKLINKQLAKNIDSFIKKNGSIDTDVKCLYARGKCPMILNNIEDYHMVKYLLYLGANPNATTSKECYTLATFISDSKFVENNAEILALLIVNGMNIYLEDGDEGQSICDYLENDIELCNKVLKILKLKTLEEFISKYSKK
jgi:hypothetical protein